MCIKNKQLKNQPKSEKTVFVYRDNFKHFCNRSCPFNTRVKIRADYYGECKVCPVGTIEDHDHEVRKEFYKDIKRTIFDKKEDECDE